MSSVTDTLPATDSAVQGDTTTAAPAVKDTPDYKAELVKELLTPEAEAPTAPPTEPPATNAEAEKPKEAEKAEEPAPKAPEEAKAEAKPEKAEEAEKTEDDDELVEPGPDATHGEKVAWGKLKAKLKQAREEGQFGQILAKVGASAGITPEDMAGWVGLRARMAGGDATAIEDLKKMVGIKDPPPPKPAVNDISEKVYKDLFEDVVNSSDMTEEAGRAKAKVIAERMIAQMPEPEPERPQSTARQIPQTIPDADPVSRAASVELDRLDTEMATKVPKWDAIRKEVFEIIATKHAGAPAIRWVPIFNEVARDVQMKYTKPAAAVRVKPTESMKPSVSSSASSESQNYKAELVRDLLAGKL